jgi:hypothetical protein
LNSTNKVIVGGLLYPLKSNLNLNKYHSNSLFGLEKDQIKFIVDGIYIKDDDKKEDLAVSKREFLNRVLEVADVK